ncbi:MAG TPA: hypothetical protein VMF58_13015 [Rhizomicrobium sp.]|nr:hypothetical protein [Rhizomicrobium sp.]
MRCVLASFALMLLPMVAAAAPLFEAQLKAKRTDEGIQVVVLLTNRARRSACYPAITPGITMKYRDGTSSVMVSTNEPSWEYGAPPPLPVQVVPADGSTRAYPWFFFPSNPSDTKAGEMTAVETGVVLYDCKALFSAKPSTYVEVFHATVAGPVE